MRIFSSEWFSARLPVLGTQVAWNEVNSLRVSRPCAPMWALTAKDVQGLPSRSSETKMDET